MKRNVVLFLLLSLSLVSANAQFPISIPKINLPKVEKPRPGNTPTTQTDPRTGTPSASAGSEGGKSQNRQMVMDDGYTLFNAEPLGKFDNTLKRGVDIGWYLKSRLRILGTFPARSAFRIGLKKSGKQISSVRCEGDIYTKENDSYLSTPALRKDKDLNFEDFMITGFRCFDEKTVNKEIGKLDVEIYFIDGDTDAETLVRTYKIDVHRTSKVGGSPTNSYQDVSDYSIQRHAENAVAFIHLNRHRDSGYFGRNPAAKDATKGEMNLIIYTSFAPAKAKIIPNNAFARCSVNGERVKLPVDIVNFKDNQHYYESGDHSDRLAPQYKRGPAYLERVTFSGLTIGLPIETGKKVTFRPQFFLDEHPGKWECSVISNSVVYRTFRWEVGADGRIAPHAEQKNGNVNLFYNSFLIDMEVPAGGSPSDFRLIPMPNAGLFYGIPWTSSEGKAMAARMPKVGSPYETPSDKQ